MKAYIKPEIRNIQLRPADSLLDTPFMGISDTMGGDQLTRRHEGDWDSENGNNSFWDSGPDNFNY